MANPIPASTKLNESRRIAYDIEDRAKELQRQLDKLERRWQKHADKLGLDYDWKDVLA